MEWDDIKVRLKALIFLMVEKKVVASFELYLDDRVASLHDV